MGINLLVWQSEIGKVHFTFGDLDTVLSCPDFEILDYFDIDLKDGLACLHGIDRADKENPENEPTQRYLHINAPFVFGGISFHKIADSVKKLIFIPYLNRSKMFEYKHMRTNNKSIIIVQNVYNNHFTSCYDKDCNLLYSTMPPLMEKLGYDSLMKLDYSLLDYPANITLQDI